jgi:O-antigen biosynthesis protein
VSDELCSIVIATYKNGEMLRECLESIIACLGPIDDDEYEIVCVVNGAQFQWTNSLVGPLRGVRLIESAVNLGFSGGYNLAARHSRGKYIVLLNDDTIVQPNWLRPLIETARRLPGVGVVGSCNLSMQGTIEEAGSVVFSDGQTMGVGRGLPGDSMEWDFVRDVDYCSASSLLVTREAWEAVGGLDEQFHPAYHEDVDLCLRVRERGYRIVYEPRSKVMHHVSQSTDLSFRLLLMRRNREIPLRRFVNKFRQNVFPPRRVEDVERHVERAAQRARGMRRQVLLIDDLLPSTGIGAGFSRPLQMLQDLGDAREAVTIAPTYAPERTTDALRDLGVRVVEGSIETFLRRPEIIFDAAIISRPTNLPWLDLVRATHPEATVIMDHEALYHRRLFRQAAMATTPEEAARLTALAEDMLDQETRAVAAVDFNVCISEEEADFVRAVPAAAPVLVLEPRAPQTIPTPNTLAGRRDMLFVAGWMAGSESPNVGALVWFVERVLPRVRAAIPWARVRVTGASPPPEVRALASDGVQICGFVDDLTAAYSAARAVIAPIRVGAGVKLKTVEALEYGVPTVATVVGAEGIDLGGHADAITITDDEGAYADRLIELLTDADAWRRARAGIDGLLSAWGQRESVSWSAIIDAAAAAKRNRTTPPLSWGHSDLQRLA